jgi:hypothetical protein
MYGNPDLLEIVSTVHPPGRLAGRLHGWQQQGNENPNDGDNNQQFHECETFAKFHDTLHRRVREEMRYRE